MNPQDEELQDSPLLGDEDGPEGIEIELDPDEVPEDLEGSGLQPVEDQPEAAPQDFNGNLAADLANEHEDVLGHMGLDISQSIDEDLRGRKEWEDTYSKSLKYLGIKEDEGGGPWPNSCRVVHPILTEGITRFQSRASAKIFSQGGPVKIDVDSEVNQQVQTEAVRAQRKINSYFNSQMPEFRPETEKLLFGEAQIGVAFKKNYFSTRLGRVVSQFVKAENLILPYGCESVETCERITEIVRKTESDVKTLQKSGLYRSLPVGLGQEKIFDVEQEKSELTGVDVSQTLNEGVKLYECHIDLFIEEDQFASPTGEPSPYIVTVEVDESRILSIRRNWRQEDPLRKKRNIFTPYVYVPSDGPYGYGLVHLVGTLASSITSILRQLIDAGELANVPAWFKSKDAKMSSQGALAPGEIRDVDVTPAELSNAFMPIPVKEPSQSLFQLLQLLIEKGEAFSSMSDLEISASSQNAPVGTTLALLERQTEISNAVQSRLYDSLRLEFALIKDILKEFQPEVYDDIFGRLESLTGCPCVILPVGDPRSSTQSQRLILLQQVTQMATQAPEIYDMAALHRAILTDMGIDDVDVLIPDATKIQPADPMTETMAMLTSKPIKAFAEQDHQAHIAVHQAVKNDPYLQQMLAQNPKAMQIMAANEAHIAEHLAFQFMTEVQGRLGMQLPQPGQSSPQQDAQIARMVSGAVSQMVAEHAQQAKAQQAQQQAQDPAFQLALREVQIKDQARQDKHELGMAKLQLEQDSREKKNRLELVRIASQAQQAEQADDTKKEIEGVRADNEQASIAADAFKHLHTVYSQADNGQEQ